MSVDPSSRGWNEHQHRLPWPLSIAAGKLGLNQPAPAEVLDVVGNIKASGLVLPSGAIGTLLLAANAVTNDGFAQSGSSSTASATLVDITGLSIAITTTGGHVLVFGHVNCQNTGANATSIAVALDGTNVNNIAKITHKAAGADEVVSFAARLTPATGAHTIKLQWLTSAGTVSLTAGINSELMVVELKR